MDDANATRAIRDALRVTVANGLVIVGFYQMSPAMVRFLTEIGLIHDGVLRRREAIAMGRMSSRDLMARLRHAHNGSTLRSLAALFRMRFGISREERLMRSAVDRVFREASDVDALIDALEERIPYRDLSSVRDLVCNYGVGQAAVHDHGTCCIAELRAPPIQKVETGNR